MKKIFRLYIISWFISLILFNIICFVTPDEINGFLKFDGSFWIGYVCIMVAFVGQLACAYFALNQEDNKRTFYNISIVSISYSSLILTIIIGSICMVIPNLPSWLGGIICLLILGFKAIAVVKAIAVAEIVGSIDEKIERKKFFIKAIQVDAEHLYGTIKIDELKEPVRKVYEALRFSDPISNDALEDVELSIKNEFSVFEDAVNRQDKESVNKSSELLLALIDKRNKKCKLLK